MANDVAGLYINTGNGMVLQNSGVCKRQGDKSECEIYAHNGSQWNKIYPRQQDWNLPSGANGGIAFCTFRQNYSNLYTNKAMQGWYGGYTGSSSGQQIGNIYWRNGKPTAPGTLVSVDRVRFSINRNVHTGWYNNTITGYLRMSPNTNNGTFASQVDAVRNSPQFTFSWLPYGNTTTIDNNSGLNNFFYQFLSNSYYNSITLYSGETSGSGYAGERYSANYAGTMNVQVEIWAKYQT